VTEFALTRRHPQAAHFAAEATSMLGLVLNRVARWMKVRADRRLLASMPDYLLSDIGISRGSIDHATVHGRSGF